MSDSEPGRDPFPEINDLADSLSFLRDNDIPLPDDGLTLERIRRRGEEFANEDDGFSFQVVRHPSPRFSSKSMTGKGRATPARWHKTNRYHYDLSTGKWEITELDREFRFSPWELIQAEFDSTEWGDVWEEKIERVQAAANPEAELETELAPVEEGYRSQFHEVPDAQVEEMLSVLRTEFRNRAGLD